MNLAYPCKHGVTRFCRVCVEEYASQPHSSAAHLWKVYRPGGRGRGRRRSLVAAFATCPMAREWVFEAPHRSRDVIEAP